jgi:hypothetical protein
MSTRAGRLPWHAERGSADRAARTIVWCTWLGMLALLLWSFARMVSAIPLAEDWLYVRPLTEDEPGLAAWLWEQNNEHRMPIARLALLGTLKATGGDFRAGGLLNLALLGAGAAALILFVGRVRGGTDAADAFFPLLLLHFGHSSQVLFPNQIVFVLAIGLIVAAGCTLFAPESVTTPLGGAVAGIALLLLPLSGFIGLFFVPALACFLLYAGISCRRGWRGWPRKSGLGLWLMGSCAGALALTAFYFVGYEHPWWNPPSPGMLASMKTALKVLSLAFGPAAEFWWTPAVAAVAVVIASTLWLSARRVSRHSGAARDYAVGAALFLTVSAIFALAVGWGRAAYVPQFGIPIRYVVLALPVSVGSYLTCVASLSTAGRMGTRGLAAALLLLLPLNHLAGHRFFADWYREGMSRVEADIRQGLPVDELATRHQPFLIHWWTPEELARHMRMLRQAGIAPFDRAAEAR